MESMRELCLYVLGDMRVKYLVDSHGRVGLTLSPAASASREVAHRGGIGHEPFIASMPDAGDPPALRIDPLIHLSLRGDDAASGFSNGRTMRWSPTNDVFVLKDHTFERNGTTSKIITVLCSIDGIELSHTLTHVDDDHFLTVFTTMRNGSPIERTIDAITSFSLSGISPFDSSDSANRIEVHRVRTAWSAEGRLETRSIEELHLERSWSGHARLAERFGQVGTMPTSGWFPFIALSDRVAGVSWGAQLAWAGSWQIEVARQHDDICISGGLADREFGHWSKSVRPGEIFHSPPAYLSCTVGNVDDITDRLVSAQASPADEHPAFERELPIIFNEWCTTWGEPSHRDILAIADRLSGEGIGYLVIDAGWYRARASEPWSDSHGDWIPSRDLFPDGIAATAAAIRTRGMIPGIWFELETVGATSTAFTLVDHVLKRDGRPLTVGSRRFWDFTDPFVVSYLSERVIDFLEENEFGYLKVDYNETIGMGSDSEDGLGAGLHAQVMATYEFFDLIRQRLPNLVIENCASGGHRLEPSMIGRTAMSSFSDAHELPEIPLIASGLQRMMLPRQMQIWSVLHASDSPRRLVYSLAATFLGRMCLSGDVINLNDEQWGLVRRSIGLYRQAVPTIRAGRTRRFGSLSASLRHPEGWQGVLRISSDGSGALAVVHGFKDAPAQVLIPIDDRWKVGGVLSADEKLVSIQDQAMVISGLRDFDTVVILLERR